MRTRRTGRAAGRCCSSPRAATPTAASTSTAARSRALAEEVRTVDRQLALERGLDELKAAAKGLPHVSEALTALRATPDVAWRAFACSLLAEELGAG